MFDKNIYIHAMWHRISRLVFMLFLASFAAHQAVDACSDPFCVPIDVVGETSDSDADEIIASDEFMHERDSFRKFETAKQASKVDQIGPQQASLLAETARRITSIQDSAHDIKSSQIYPPASSDVSPPSV